MPEHLVIVEFEHLEHACLHLDEESIAEAEREDQTAMDHYY